VSKSNNPPSRTALRRQLRQLARNFADDIVELLDRQGVWDDGAGDDNEDEAKRVRRSPDALSQVKERILAELAALHTPASIGAIANRMGLTSRQITHPLSLLVDDQAVLRSGARRGARYQLAPRKRASKKKRAAPKRG
jgi:hypothetical protein